MLSIMAVGVGTQSGRYVIGATQSINGLTYYRVDDTTNSNDNSRALLILGSSEAQRIVSLLNAVQAPPPPPATQYALTVANGSGDGSYAAGTVVPIVANAAPSGQVFSRWTGATVANATAASTTLTMPATATTVTATYAAQTPPAPSSGLANPGPTLTWPRSVFGSAIMMGTIWNITLDSHDVSYRFRATHDGALQAMVLYIMHTQSGYGAGTGGVVQITVRADDGSSAHQPSTVLASYTMTNPRASYFPVVTFATPATLTAGQLYHIVFHNTDANPTANYVSVNPMADSDFSSSLYAPAMPTVSDTDWAVLWKSGSGSWSQRLGFSPILELRYADGVAGGVGYMEYWGGTGTSTASATPIGSTESVREKFTVTDVARTVTGFHVRTTSGSGTLHAKLYSNGALVEDLPLASEGHGWMGGTFQTPRVLALGPTYEVRLSTSGGSYKVDAIRQGKSYNFSAASYFGKGEAQWLNGGAWTGWDAWGSNNRHEQDLQFYFDVQ